MSKTLKLAFVGCGAIAPYHLNGIKEHAPRIQVTAAIDPDRAKAEQIAAETGAQVFGSLEEGLAHGDFDAVDVLTPHHLHEPLAIQAFAAGKHVVLEKPMATTLAACDRIFAAGQTGRHRVHACRKRPILAGDRQGGRSLSSKAPSATSSRPAPPFSCPWTRIGFRMSSRGA